MPKTSLALAATEHCIKCGYRLFHDSFTQGNHGACPRGGIASIPINIPTQGLPESFQSVGLIQSDGGVLPLYGRRTMRGGDRWNYYTRTDTFNPIPVPVRFQRRDCMDDVGCQEILSGEHVKIEALGKEGTAKIYRFDGPKYIPGLL